MVSAKLYTPKGHLKGQCLEIFDFRFFHESVSPKPLSIPLGPFRIIYKIREYNRTLTWEYLREFSKKIRNDPTVIFRALGEGDS
jgi:hypothetical protein